MLNIKNVIKHNIYYFKEKIAFFHPKFIIYTKQLTYKLLMVIILLIAKYINSIKVFCSHTNK